MKPAVNRKPFKMDYRRNPDGPGGPAEWRSAFRFRLGLDAAREAVGSKSPESILGVPVGAAWGVIKAAYRRLVRIHHPDVGGQADMFRVVQGAFEVLEDRIGKGAA